jgi:disulfide bond formation protein DsbB
MYPLVVLLGLATARRGRELVIGSLALAVPGALFAAYHSLIQYLPSLERGVCSVGSCTAKLWTLGPLSIPNLSLLAFAAIAVTLAVRLR